MFLLERIALLQEPMKVKIYISFYFVGLFFYLVTYWEKKTNIPCKIKKGYTKGFLS